MEDLGVIVKVSQPTDWVNSITTPEKQRTGALRLCLDPRDLKHAITLPTANSGGSNSIAMRC